MQKFHYMENPEFQNDITELYKKLNCRSFTGFFILIFRTKSETATENAVKFINCLDYQRLIIQTTYDCTKNVYIRIEEEVHRTLKHFHDTMNTFSMAEIFRSMIIEAVNFIVEYGLEIWHIYLEELLLQTDEHNEIKKNEFINHYRNIDQAHMCLNYISKSKKMAFFDFSSHYLDFVPI